MKVMKVQKFGSATLATADRIKHVAEIVLKESKNLVVVSSIKGTAEALEDLSGYLYKKNNEGAVEILNKLHINYKKLVGTLFRDEKALDLANKMLAERFAIIRNYTQDLFTLFEERELMAQGELISADLFYIYMQQKGAKVALLPALEFMKTDKNRIPDSNFLNVNLTKMIDASPEADYYITQGYICCNSYGEVDDLGKGGSDYTAALVGAAIEAEEIQIWEEVEVMLNNDADYVESTKVVSQINFNEAAELAYFGAEILHPTRISPAKFANIPVRLCSTQDLNSQGTIISNETEEGTIKAIAARSGITAIRIKSGEMLLAHGFLRKVFEVFEQYQTPIDMLTTSEVGVSLTIDDTRKLEYILEELKKYGTVQVDSNMSIVSIVGDLESNKTEYLSQIIDAVKHLSLRMVSYGGSRYNVSLLVSEKDKKETLQALHSKLFN